MTRDADSRPAISCRWCRMAYTPKPKSAWRTVVAPAQTALNRTPIRTGLGRRAGPPSPTGSSSSPAPPSRARTFSWPTSTRCVRRQLSLRHTAVLGGAAGHRSVRAGTRRADGRHRPGWRLVTALAAGGDVDAAGRPRRSSTPRSSATRPRRANGSARSRRRAPAVRGQGAAWTQVTEDDTLANIVGRSIIDGFVQPGQGELLKPFGARYFAAIAGCGSAVQRGGADSGGGPVPSWDISNKGIAAADEFLAEPALPPALRRLVLEGRAGVERSLRARQLDRGGTA